MTTLTTIGHGLSAGFETGGNLVIADGSSGLRVVVQRTDVPDLLRAVMGGEDYERTVAPRLLADLRSDAPVAARAAGLESSAAIAMRREAENAPPTRAGALMATFLADAPAAPSDPATLLRAAIVKAAPAYCDPAGLLTLATALKTLEGL